MTMRSILLICISLCIQNQVHSSPVLLWSNAHLPEITVSFSTLSPLEVVSTYICKLESQRINVRLFAVNGLKNEDIQRGSQSNHPILVDAQKENSQFRYIPNVVDNAYETFSLIPQSNNMQCAHIQFQMASTNTYQSLEEALNAMQTSVETDAKTTTVMVLLGSPFVEETLIRERRDIDVPEEDVLISDDGSCMFYADELYWMDSNETVPANYSLQLDKSSCKTSSIEADNTNHTSTVLELAWEKDGANTITTTLIANVTGLYWQLISIKLDGSEYRYFAYGMYSEMDTPPTFSYVCTTATFVKYDRAASGGKGAYDFNNKFSIKSFQFQPFSANGTSFGPPNYCTSFFTSGIWMGIMASLLCLAILSFGIYRMMSIRPNDRVDDPKSKPLIIKAQE